MNKEDIRAITTVIKNLGKRYIIDHITDISKAKSAKYDIDYAVIVTD